MYKFKDTPGPVAGRCVLVVDDNRDSARTLGWMLEMLGYEPHLAHDGPAALDLARSLRPDVVMLDISLPGGVSGYDICRSLKAELSSAGTIFVAQTGWENAEHLRRSAEAGFDYHCVKPVRMEDLQEMTARAA